METKSPESLKTERQRLLKRRESLLDSFTKAAGSGKHKPLSQLAVKIRHTNEFLSALDLIEAETKPKEANGPRRYAVSSLFLHESFRKLTADQDEQFFFVTGAEVDGVMVLDQRAEFIHQERTMMGVKADPRSTLKLLIKLEQFGHRLLAHFHSHPGRGADATHPSGTDEKFQKRLESGGHVAIMVIFSRDGFVRFVRLDESQDVEVYGAGVEKHESGIFRLTNLD